MGHSIKQVNQKLVIAMALINDPKILLLDEPFAALDILTIKRILIHTMLYTEGETCAPTDTIFVPTKPSSG